MTFSAREGQQWENNDNSSWTQTLSPSRSTTYITPEPDSTAAALGGEMDPSMYNSTYSEYYPPLNYEPNKPITRNNISDADAKYKLKLERRQSLLCSRRTSETRVNAKGSCLINDQPCSDVDACAIRVHSMIRQCSTVNNLTNAGKV